MPLLNCPECSNKVSDQADSCPQCGYPLSRMREIKQKEVSATHSKSTTHSAAKPKKMKHRWWLILVGLAVLGVSSSMPSISLLFGLGVIFFCAGVFIPQIKSLSCRLLRIDPGKRWQTIARVSMFGVIGLFFLLFSIGSFGAKVDRERLAAEQAANQAKQEKLHNEANKRVADLAKQAEELWAGGDLQGARDKIALANQTQHASNLHPVRKVEAKIANAKVEAIMFEAISAAKDGRLDVAKGKVVEAHAVQGATNLESARELQKHLDLVENPKQIEKILLDISEEEFAALRNGTMPSSLITDRLGIDQQIKDHVQQRLDQIVIIRKKLREEEARKQRIRAAAESFVKSGVGRKVPYQMWNVLGQPETLEGTDNRHWVVYLSKGDVSFVSEKSSDKVIFAAFGKSKAQEFLAEKKAKRKDQIEGQFSVWDGSHRALTKLIKQSMNDPSSYDHVETVYWDMGDHLLVRTTFRGKNAFGGVVKNWVKARVDLNGNVIKVVGQGP